MLKRIGLKTVDRGGSNLVLGFFHYHPEFFSLSEKVVFDTRDYSSWPSSKNRPCPVDDNGARTSLRRDRLSMFGGRDKHKKIDKVRNIVIKIPRTTHVVKRDLVVRDNGFRYEYYEHHYDKVCYVIRNPFRVALSHHSVHNRNLEEYLKSTVDWTVERLLEYKDKNTRHPDCKLIFLEHLVKHFETEFPKLIKWGDEDAQPIVDLNLGLRFARDSCLSGRGHGAFDPRKPVSYLRLMSKNLQEPFVHGRPRTRPKKPAPFPTSALHYAREKLGPEVFDYWYNDKQHNYAHELNLDLI